MAIKANENAASSAGPVVVEEGGLADVAHLAHALNDALPGDDVVWKKTHSLRQI